MFFGSFLSQLIESEKLKQLKIYYLFMDVDGKSSISELRYLDDIIQAEELSESTIQSFQNFCEQMSLKMSVSTPKLAITEIDNILEEKSLLTSASLNNNKLMQAQTIWTLINLGYADDEYSEAERQIVDHLIKRWETDSALVSEFNDTADTILALTLQKQWIQNTSKPYADINKIMQELDRNITSMFANIETSITEADIT